jgi:glycosyltransferase involved in cell wall biosynthesis
VKLCVVSFKECWSDGSGGWMTDGGFSRQMAAIASLVDEMVIVTATRAPRAGGNPLPRAARLVPLRCPVGRDARRKLSVVSHLPEYVRAIAAEVRHADAVHVPLPGDLPLIGMMVAHAFRKPLLARYGSSWSVNNETTTMNRVTKQWMRMAAGGRNVMVATGEGNLPPAAGMHWLFASAVSASELAQLSSQLDRPLSAPPRLVYAGRLSPEKGLPVLLKAMAEIQHTTNATLSIAGDGPDRPALEAEARRLQVSQRVRFLGQLDRAQLSVCLSAADVCVHPSHTESLCKAWLDAMAHGLPVIACDVGAARAAIGEDGERGLLVPPADPHALAGAVIRMLTEPRDWPAARRRCHDFVQTRTLEKWAERLGRLCASQWGLSVVDGKLRPCVS